MYFMGLILHIFSLYFFFKLIICFGFTEPELNCFALIDGSNQQLAKTRSMFQVDHWGDWRWRDALPVSHERHSWWRQGDCHNCRGVHVTRQSVCCFVSHCKLCCFMLHLSYVLLCVACKLYVVFFPMLFACCSASHASLLLCHILVCVLLSES